MYFDYYSTVLIEKSATKIGKNATKAIVMLLSRKFHRKSCRRASLKINFQGCLTKCQVPTDWCLTVDILCLTKNINATEQI